MSRRKPAFLFRERFHAELTDRYERPYIFKREVHECTFDEGFAFRDRNGILLRPSRKRYDSDGASIPFGLTMFPCFDRYKYKEATMGIHDPACRFGELEAFFPLENEWKVIPITRAQADDLLSQAIQALGGWRLTAETYWAGVRIGALGELIKGAFMEVVDSGGRGRTFFAIEQEACIDERTWSKLRATKTVGRLVYSPA